MQKLIITYLIGAALTYLATMVWFFRGWKQMVNEEKEVYPESAGAGIVAACTLFIIAFLMAVLWPFVPPILLAVFVYDKIQERNPELCGIKEEEGECDTQTDSREGSRDHFCQ